MANKIEIKTTGYRVDTSDNYLINAGAIFINPTIDAQNKTIMAETIGATVGGIKVEIKVDLRQPKVDGLLVNVKGNDVINEITATISGTFKEVATDTVANSIHGDVLTASDLSGYKIVQGRNDITDADYKDVIFVGKISGMKKPLVIWLKNAINTEGLKLDTKDKDEAGIDFKFEARAEKTNPEDYQGIYKIYVPTEKINSIPATGLTVTSIAGATTGDTKITVTPAKDAANRYVIMVATSVDIPHADVVVPESFVEWDGVADIVGTTGHEIVVVEVDAHDIVQKAGKATVTSKA